MQTRRISASHLNRSSEPALIDRELLDADCVLPDNVQGQLRRVASETPMRVSVKARQDIRLPLVVVYPDQRVVGMIGQRELYDRSLRKPHRF